MVILYYHTLAFENRADSVKKYGDIIFFYLLRYFQRMGCKTGVCPADVCKRHTPVCFSSVFSYATIRYAMTASRICRITKRITTWLSDHLYFRRTWSCSGVLVFLRIAIFRKRSKNTLTRPIPPSTIITPAISRYKNGWRDCMARMAM